MNAIRDKAPQAIDTRVAREAAHWLMRLHSSEYGETDRQACQAWRAAHPAHELAWQRAELLMHTLGMVPPAIGMPVLDRRASRQRRATVGALAILIAAGPVAWATWRAAPWREWSAGVRTARGEIRSMTLDDGTRLALNTDTALDIAFDRTTRLIKLHSGEIHIETAADPLARPRPFVVQTEHGRLRALGTRFSVRKDAALRNTRTQVAVSAGAVGIRPARADQTDDAGRVVEAGWQASFDEDAISAATILRESMHAWVNGVLLADDTPLSNIATELARYRPGVVRCDSTIADLRVSGAFQLKDTDNILYLLQQSLPIRVRTRTRFWVHLEAA